MLSFVLSGIKVIVFSMEISTGSGLNVLKSQISLEVRQVVSQREKLVGAKQFMSNGKNLNSKGNNFLIEYMGDIRFSMEVVQFVAVGSF